MTKVCDGTPDCPLGDDEKSCVALGDDIEDNEVIPYNEEGNNHYIFLIYFNLYINTWRLEYKLQ